VTGSFVARLARITVLVAAAGAALTAVVSTYIAHRLLVAGMDTRMRGAATALADEIAQLPDAAALAADVDEDSRELHHAGLQIAVFTGGRRLSGDPAVPAATVPGCSTNGDGMRLCAVAAGPRMVVVAGRAGEVGSQLRLFGEAAALAVAVTLAAALLIARRLAARVMGPLTRLRALVATVPEHAPGSAALGADEGWEEVDALRRVLAALLVRLDRALVQARTFAADAAHELRTPVATMRAELELLAEDPGDPSAAREALARVHRTLLASSALIERLLILALPPGSAPAEGQAVAMADVVREAIAALPEASRTRTSADCQDEGIVRGDGALLRALVDNALDNALKFGAAAPVTVTVTARANRVLTTFQDGGPGIPLTERGRVFQPFYRTPEARASTVRGHGIGLALIAHVTAGHGGEAAFGDSPRGALLEVTLPAWTPG
jgi:two-component system OmpR family sensor kinase